MTRQALLSRILLVPLAAFTPLRPAEAERDHQVVSLGPGRYTVGPDGGIYIDGADGVRIENCTFEDCSVTL